MQQQGIDIREALLHIDPGLLDYQDWCNVGMALKHEGFSPDVWDQWSSRDPARYHPGECLKKWQSFRGKDVPVTGGTIVQYAMDQGWSPAGEGSEIGWDESIGSRKAKEDSLKVVNSAWLEMQDVPPPPAHMDGAKELIRYLKALFESSENVGYVTQSYINDDGRHVPTKGSYDRTAGQLIQALTSCNGDIGAVLGDYSPEAGAWIRFNPLDGKGVKNENVTDFRYALVESDTLDLSKQYTLIKELQIPVAIMVHSGGKSIHAIVRIDAQDYDEYRKRVDYLYSVCQKNGMQLDRQNRNPSRLSRMPGVMRKGKPQYIIAENIGFETFQAWKEYIESINDDLPDSENLADLIKNMPPLAPELIKGILRCGHKMLISGPSKAGKSFGLIELCIAIAEGGQWFGMDCMEGNVMYVNLELDRASCIHRFSDVYKALKIPIQHPERIEVWNLRGSSAPMDSLAPKLIRRAKKKGYIAVILDPIYKVITGDENAADQMSRFCNQFDRICNELGCAVIYCHHHSKGSQGQKRSMDRASGSGVFARDPDALLDLLELDVPLSTRENMINSAIRDTCIKWLDMCVQGWRSSATEDMISSHVSLQSLCASTLSAQTYQVVLNDIEKSKELAKRKSAWRLDGVLREFAPMKPKYLWFNYPIHVQDDTGDLKELSADGEKKKDINRATDARKKSAENKRLSKKDQLENAILLANGGDPVTVKHVADFLNAKENTVRKWLRENGYAINRNDGTIVEVEVLDEDI